MRLLLIGAIFGAIAYGSVTPAIATSVNENNRSWCLNRKAMYANGEGDNPDMGTIQYCGDRGVSVLH
jgi:hypothetical protein